MSVFEATSPSNLDVVIRLVVATGLGAAVGFERELDGQDAGMRTHALLALGAAMFGVLSVGAFGDFVVDRAASNVQVDVTRIASYVAAGVGFLAGGAIVKQSDRVRGLTTAASLWSVAALGLAAGLGFWVGSAAAAVMTLLLLLAEKPLAMLRLRKRGRTLSVRLRADADATAVIDLLVPASGDAADLSFVKEDDGTSSLLVRGVRPERARSLIVALEARDDVLRSSVE